jgi:parallel beta-helix repeat protein
LTTNPVVPTDGMTITENTTLVPGTYTLPQGLVIDRDEVTLDAAGVHIVGADHQGVGVRADGLHNIVIRGLSVSGYYHGVRIDRCNAVTITGLTVRDTAEIEGIDTFLNLWQPIENAYGGAILLNDVHHGVVYNNDAQHQFVGVQLYNCSNVAVEKNNASFNSGWGVYLSRSSDNTIQDNQLDFCNRVFRRDDGSIRVEADAAGIVLVHGSSRNQLLRNSCLCGGDGIFICGYYHPGDHNSCSDNLVEDNDCRLSPNNAIESTFSRGNIFRRNDCSDSNYGFWLGYSWDNIVEDNHIEFNRWVGIAAEHTHDMIFRGNAIQRNGEGVRLWTRGGAVVEYFPSFEVCYNCTLESNLIEANGIGFNGYTGDDAKGKEGYRYHLSKNTIRDNRVGARFSRVRECSLDDNVFEANVQQAIHLDGAPGVSLGSNHMKDNATDILET